MNKATQKPETQRQLITVGVNQTGPCYWLGQSTNGIDYYAGQSFKSPVNGLLKKIRVFTAIVKGNPEAQLKLFAFNQQTHTWIAPKAAVKTLVDSSAEGTWTTFDIPGMRVKSDEDYAFKLSCGNSGMMAIAESSWNNFNAYADGEEWTGSSLATEGNFHKDFDLAFEVEFEVVK